jgi:hypothetical protein
VYVTETPLSDIGAYVTGFEDSWLSAPAREYPTIAIPGRQGVVFAADPTTAARTLRIVGSISPAVRTVAARQAAEDQLKALTYRAQVKVIVDDDVTSPRQIDAVCTSCAITPRGHPVDAVVSGFALSFLCPDPTWSDVVGQMIGFSTVATPVPLGTAPSGGIIRVAAPSWSANVTGLVVSYLNAAGVTIGSMTFTTTLTAGTDYIEIDLDRATITDYNSGTASSGAALLTAGDFFSLDPIDGDPLNASYPMLKLSSSAGTPSGQWLGARRWL